MRDELDTLPHIRRIGTPAADRYFGRRVTELKRALADLEEVIAMQSEWGMVPQLGLAELRERIAQLDMERINRRTILMTLRGHCAAH